MNAKYKKKLLLKKETLRNLQDCELRLVVGGEQAALKQHTATCGFESDAKADELAERISIDVCHKPTELFIAGKAAPGAPVAYR